jgi:hypothetical protein
VSGESGGYLSVFQVLGGDCFQRLYGESLFGTTSLYGGSVGSPTKLDDEMRLLLETNTAEFIERMEARRLEFEAMLARSRQVTGASAQPPGGTAATPKVGRRFIFPVDDPSAALYEGSAMLSWRWTEDRDHAAARLAKANPAPGSNMETVVRHYAGFDHNHSPYQFALKVELKHFFPKSVILRTLHQLELIEQA